MSMIPFNKPFLTGKETAYIKEAVDIGHISGNGMFTKKCQAWFENKYGFQKCLLTTSCTDALEMSALLLDIQPGDEVIVPSYTFVSSALAFVRQGAKIVFCDSGNAHPGIDENSIEKLITSKTKAIVVVHYAGVATDMDKVMKVAEKHKLYVVEDAAQAFDAYYGERPLAGIGHLGCLSFHETKNIQCGEGGMLVINDERFKRRAEIIWEKGTNRAEFFRGEVSKYSWVDIGSSFLPPEINAAFLFAQLENSEEIQKKRMSIWNRYSKALSELAEQGHLGLPVIPDYASNNAHMFYVICRSREERGELIHHLKVLGIAAVFHYITLHNSPYYDKQYEGGDLPNSREYSDRLLRLPLFYELTGNQQQYIIDSINQFFKKKYKGKAAAEVEAN